MRTLTIRDADVIQLTPYAVWVCGRCGETGAKSGIAGAACAAGDQHAYLTHGTVPPVIADARILWDAALLCAGESDEALIRQLREAFGDGSRVPAAAARARYVLTTIPDLEAVTPADLRTMFRAEYDRLIGMNVGMWCATNAEKTAAKVAWSTQQRITADTAAVLLTRTLAKQGA